MTEACERHKSRVWISTDGWLVVAAVAGAFALGLALGMLL